MATLCHYVHRYCTTIPSIGQVLRETATSYIHVHVASYGGCVTISHYIKLLRALVLQCQTCLEIDEPANILEAWEGGGGGGGGGGRRGRGRGGEGGLVILRLVVAMCTIRGKPTKSTSY